MISRVAYIQPQSAGIWS